MKIIQICNSLAYGDGVSNCILSMSEIFDEIGYSNDIITSYADERIKNRRIIIRNLYGQMDIGAEDIVLYHLGIGTPTNYIIENLSAKKILVYHNVTEPSFFRGINDNLEKDCLWGIYDAKKTVGKYLKSIVLSEFSKNNLLEMGWEEKDVWVLPLIKVNDVDIKPNFQLVDEYRDGYVNILFTGRMAPHKKIEDIIKIFSYYQKYYNHKSRLILTGGIALYNYYDALINYVKKLKANNVIFTNHVSNEDLEAYYTVADVFLCMSEHEGFCIPLVEAMKREIPIIAYSAAAVPNTLGEAGVLLNTKDENEIAQCINRLILDSDFRKKVVDTQNERVNVLSLDNYKLELRKVIEEVRQIETYSYNFEERELEVNYDIGGQTVYLNDLLNLLKDHETLVVYGIGRVGKKIFAGCQKYINELGKTIVICDNAFTESTYNGIPVIKHKECVTTYPEALYIVTIQNACVDVIADLINSNIKKQNIKFYHSSLKKIC